MQQQEPDGPGNAIVIAIFLVLLAVPGALALAGLARPDTRFIMRTEGRSPFVAPPISSGALATGGYERDLERQIGDAFPLRSHIIDAYGDVKFFLLGESTTENTVRGRDGWLFYANEERRYVTGTWRPTDGELAHVADVYRERARWCEQRGVRYVLVFAPNKSTIYAEMAPAWYRPEPPTPLDRLLPMLAARGVTTVDVRDRLRAAARTREVYSRGDSHWNGPGAYIAYGAVVDALRPAGVRDEIRPTGFHTVSQRGDLLVLNGVGDTIGDSVTQLAFRRRAVPAATPAYATGSARPFSVTVTTTTDAHLPVLVLFGDSFSNGLAPLLAEDARRFVHLQQGPIDKTPQFDRAAVEAEHPAAVVQELVERNLYFGSSFVP